MSTTHAEAQAALAPLVVGAAQTTPTLPVKDRKEAFAVHRIYCVARNYAAHAREMGVDPERTPPEFFGKPADAAFVGSRCPYPPATSNLHHEVELVVAMSAGGKDLSAEQARASIFGYAVGLDLTRRDLQHAARSRGGPWDMAKGFDFSAPCSPLARVSEVGHPRRGFIRLSVNGVSRQSSDLEHMIWNVEEIICQLSTLVTVQAGDLIFTGTPEGVGALEHGDVVAGGIEGVGELRLEIE